jgi:YNFM family putative membrane transporter
MSTAPVLPTSSSDPQTQVAKSRSTLPVAFAGFCAFLGLYVTQPMLPLLEQVFKVGKSAVSLTLTASTLGVAIAAPLIGSVADRLGRNRVFVGWAGVWRGATRRAATATGLPSLVLWRFFQGLFTPGVFAVTIAYVQEEWPEDGVGKAMAIYVTGTVIGGFSGRLASGLIVSHWNWHWCFVGTGVMVAVSTLVIQLWLPEERHFRGQARGGSMVSGMLMHLRNRRLLATFGVGFGVLFSLIATFTYVTFHLAGAPFHLGPLAISCLFFTYLFGAVVTPPCGRIIDRYGHRVAMTLAMGAAMAGMLLTLVPNLWLVVAGLALCCSGVFVAQATSTSYIGLAADHGKALAVGIYVTCYYVGGSVGAELPGFLWSFGGWAICVALVMVVQLLTIITTLIWWSTPGGATDKEPVPGYE